jgi:hypothetical protein
MPRPSVFSALVAAGLFLGISQASGAAPATPANPAPSYADLADLAVAAPLVARVEIRDVTRLALGSVFAAGYFFCGISFA